MKCSIFLIFSLVYQVAQADTLTGRVVRITDEDTLFKLYGTSFENKNWLQGIDALEHGHIFGIKPKEQISSGMAWHYKKEFSTGRWRIVLKYLISRKDHT